MERWYQKIARKLDEIIRWHDFVFKKTNVKLKFSDKLLAVRYGFSNDLFKLYGLNKENIKDYINEFDRYLSGDKIDKQYKFILDDKIVFTEIFGQYLNVPKVQYYILDKIYKDEGTIIDINEFIQNTKNQKLVIKIVNGSLGKGVHVFENREEKFLWDYDEITKENLMDNIKKLKECIITEYVEQHEYAKNIWDKSANTIRIVTCKDPETDEFVIPCAVHRFGNKGSGCVDNAHLGGYFTEIDLETGKLGYTKSEKNSTPLEIHEDSKAQIKGVKIPYWNKIKKEILEVAKHFYYIPFIAWDVIVTEKDYVVIEANPSSSLTLFQAFHSVKDTAIWRIYKQYKVIR